MEDSSINKSRIMCPHGRRKTICKECGGKGICTHGCDKYFCKECGGKGICPHVIVQIIFVYHFELQYLY